MCDVIDLELDYDYEDPCEEAEPTKQEQENALNSIQQSSVEETTCAVVGNEPVDLSELTFDDLECIDELEVECDEEKTSSRSRSRLSFNGRRRSNEERESHRVSDSRVRRSDGRECRDTRKTSTTVKEERTSTKTSPRQFRHADKGRTDRESPRLRDRERRERERQERKKSIVVDMPPPAHPLTEVDHVKNRPDEPRSIPTDSPVAELPVVALPDTTTGPEKDVTSSAEIPNRIKDPEPPLCKFDDRRREQRQRRDAIRERARSGRPETALVTSQNGGRRRAEEPRHTELVERKPVCNDSGVVSPGRERRSEEHRVENKTQTQDHSPCANKPSGPAEQRFYEHGKLVRRIKLSDGESAAARASVHRTPPPKPATVNVSDEVRTETERKHSRSPLRRIDRQDQSRHPCEKEVRGHPDPPGVRVSPLSPSRHSKRDDRRSTKEEKSRPESSRVELNGRREALGGGHSSPVPQTAHSATRTERSPKERPESSRRVGDRHKSECFTSRVLSPLPPNEDSGARLLSVSKERTSDITKKTPTDGSLEKPDSTSTTTSSAVVNGKEEKNRRRSVDLPKGRRTPTSPLRRICEMNPVGGESRPVKPRGHPNTWRHSDRRRYERELREHRMRESRKRADRRVPERRRSPVKNVSSKAVFPKGVRSRSSSSLSSEDEDMWRRRDSSDSDTDEACEAKLKRIAAEARKSSRSSSRASNDILQVTGPLAHGWCATDEEENGNDVTPVTAPALARNPSPQPSSSEILNSQRKVDSPVKSPTKAKSSAGSVAGTFSIPLSSATSTKLLSVDTSTVPDSTTEQETPILDGGETPQYPELRTSLEVCSPNSKVDSCASKLHVLARSVIQKKVISPIVPPSCSTNGTAPATGVPLKSPSNGEERVKHPRITSLEITPTPLNGGQRGHQATSAGVTARNTVIREHPRVETERQDVPSHIPSNTREKESQEQAQLSQLKCVPCASSETCCNPLDVSASPANVLPVKLLRNGDERYLLDEQGKMYKLIDAEQPGTSISAVPMPMPLQSTVADVALPTTSSESNTEIEAPPPPEKKRKEEENKRKSRPLLAQALESLQKQPKDYRIPDDRRHSLVNDVRENRNTSGDKNRTWSSRQREEKPKDPARGRPSYAERSQQSTDSRTVTVGRADDSGHRNRNFNRRRGRKRQLDESMESGVRREDVLVVKSDLSASNSNSDVGTGNHSSRHHHDRRGNRGLDEDELLVDTSGSKRSRKDAAKDPKITVRI